MIPLDETGKRFAALLSARYEFVGFLGKGGFASVYKVRSHSLGRFEALKILNEARASEEGFAERFRHEARIAASLEHPSIVKVFEFGEAGGHFWYSMQLVDGPTVARELKIRNRLDEEKALKIAIPILDALDYAHVRGVVHRDVKPDNIILDEWDRAYLMDFGIAKLDDDVVKTAAGQTFGSPAYLSPEQARGTALDGRSDVYSLGITLYQMLSGTVPFASPDRLATVTRRLHEDPEPLSAKLPGVRPRIEAVVMRALARDRDARYPAARDMKSELEAVLAEIAPRRGAPAPAPASTGGETSAQPGAWIGDMSSSGSMPTAIGTSLQAGVTNTRSQAAPRGAFWAAGAAAAAIAALALFVALKGGKRVPEPAPASLPHAEAKPSAPTPAVESPPASSTLTVSVAPVVEPPRQAPSAAPREARLKAHAAPPATRPAVRRAKYPPDVAETAEVTLAPELAAECTGRSVGVTVVVAEDGSLKSQKVISPVSDGCDAAALDALRRYKFKPALDEAGQPIEAKFSFAVRF